MILKRLFAITVLVITLGLSSGLASAEKARLFASGFMGLNLPVPSVPLLTPAATQFAMASMASQHKPAFAGSLGLRLSPRWRIEGELSYTASGVKGGGESLSRLSLLNVYYDFETKSRWKPFLSLGAGMVTHDIYRHGIDGLNIADDSEPGMAWQTGGGLNYEISDDMSLSGGYRYVGTASFEDKGYKDEGGGHELRFGVNYKLPVRRNRDVPE